MNAARRGFLRIAAVLALTFSGLAAEDSGVTPLFPKDGIPADGSVRTWDDVKNNFPQAGNDLLSVRPETKPGLAVTDLRQVRLNPEK